MKLDGTIDSVEDAIRIARELRGRPYWFRGQRQRHGNLIPSVFRPDFAGSAPKNAESQLFLEFRRIAPSVYPNCPSEHATALEWLFLMQHHGLPTRLLDWTKNILVALYFAAEKEGCDDADVWALDTNRLNKEAIGTTGIPYIESASGKVKGLAEQASTESDNYTKPERLKELWKEAKSPPPIGTQEKRDFLSRIENAPKSPVAVYPRLAFPRVASQQGVFTLHPHPDTPGSKSIEDVQGSEGLLHFRIPGEAKARILEDLFQVGIHRLFIYPDLTGLAEHLVTAEKYKKQWLDAGLDKGPSSPVMVQGGPSPFIR